jgi:hypothetical protein
MTNLLSMLASNEVPVRLRSPLRNEYLFVSTDVKKGDHVVEAHASADDVRNQFTIRSRPNGRYGFFNRARRQWLFVSNDRDQSDEVVEAHADENDERNDFDVRFVGANRFVAYSPHYGKYLFVSNRKSGSDHIVEAHRTDEERNVLALELPDPASYTLKDVKYEDANIPQDTPMSELHETVLYNPLDQSQTVAAEISVTYTTEECWTNQVGVKAGVTTSFEAGVPHIAEGKIQISVESSFTRSWGERRTESRTVNRMISTPVAPHSQLRAHYRLWVKKLTVPYSGTLVVHYTGPFGEGDYEQPVRGEYQGVLASTLVVDFDDPSKPRLAIAV